MELAAALTARRSCRDFQADPIPADVVATVLASARQGPTAGNTWALDLVLVDRPNEYWDVTLPAGTARETFRWPGLLSAPVLVIAVVDPNAYAARYAEPDKRASGLGETAAAWPVPYWWVDAGAAVMAMLLAATDAGLASLFFGQFGHEPDVRDAFGIPSDRRCVGTVALGLPATTERQSRSVARGRPSPHEFIHQGRW